MILVIIDSIGSLFFFLSRVSFSFFLFVFLFLFLQNDVDTPAYLRVLR